MKTALALVAAVVSIGLVAAIATVDRWLFYWLDPGPFVAAATPPAPDYREVRSWAALPETRDAADVALDALPATDPEGARADVFYVHPTTWVGSAWNAPFDDPAVIGATARGGTLIQASAFNACCAVYAPRYRQANGLAFTRPDAMGARAIDVAFGDVAAAFDEFVRRRDGARPFVLASHSQGTVLAARLLREKISGAPIGSRLVAAYLIGGPIVRGTLGEVPVCATPTQTGCAIGYNARGPRYRLNGLEFQDPDAPGDATFLARRICVNPISWRTDGVAVARESHRGAIFFDADTPALIEDFADAQCVDGVLRVTEIGAAPRDFMSRILDWMMGPQNYHPIEYQLFYVGIRENASARVAAYLGAQRMHARRPQDRDPLRGSERRRLTLLGSTS